MAPRSYAKPSPDELRSRLGSLEYEVTQHDATEPPFRNRFWDNHEAGLYVDIVSGEPLFSSVDKFDSGTGWPSFTKPVEGENVVDKVDISHGMRRVEVRSKHANSHSGARLRRRSASHAPTLLHQFGVAPLHPRGRARSARLR